ncbi:TA2R9 protein, partial [Rhinoptilus africanus]|nr:TA2R9 protein [Rhinoptilus africanus]
NATSYDVMTIVIISLQTFAGMWINGFMASVLCVACLKKKSFNANEKILLFLGCCRFCYLGITWVYFFLSIINPWKLFVHTIRQILSAIQSFLNISNLWVSACLCIFYCIKIANFRNIFFIYLKGKIDRIMLWLFLGSMLFALVISILVYKVIDEAHSDNFNCTGRENFWKVNIKTDEHFFPLYFLSGVGFAIAFMAVISSALLLLFSLWRHKCKMQMNSGKDLSMDAHVKAMKSILSFFFIYSINFACLVLTLIYSTKKANPVMFLTLVFQYAFPSVHSLILIFSNHKLERTLRRTLSCGKCKVCMR